MKISRYSGQSGVELLWYCSIAENVCGDVVNREI